MAMTRKPRCSYCGCLNHDSMCPDCYERMTAPERVHHTRLEADGTWTGVEIPDTMLRALGWTAYPINGTPVVVRREGGRVVIERDDEAREGPEDHG